LHAARNVHKFPFNTSVPSELLAEVPVLFFSSNEFLWKFLKSKYNQQLGNHVHAGTGEGEVGDVIAESCREFL
jgi:hypothetical protein